MLLSLAEGLPSMVKKRSVASAGISPPGIVEKLVMSFPVILIASVLGFINSDSPLISTSLLNVPVKTSFQYPGTILAILNLNSEGTRITTAVSSLPNRLASCLYHCPTAWQAAYRCHHLPAKSICAAPSPIVRFYDYNHW